MVGTNSRSQPNYSVVQLVVLHKYYGIQVLTITCLMSNWLENSEHVVAQPVVMNVLLQSYVQGAVK